MIWTNERKEQVTRLWADGLSASQIANRFGDVSRNAIISVVHRMGLPKRKVMNAPKQRRVPSPRRRPIVSKRPLYGPSTQAAPFEAREVAIDPLHLGLLQLKSTSCRYAYGDSPFTFCGYKTAGPLSYCAVHASIVYQPAKSRQRKAVLA